MPTYGRRRVIAAIFSSFTLAAVPAGAAADVNGFQGADGDQAAACGAAVDWQCLGASEYLTAADAGGAADNSFGGASKEGDPAGWTLQTGSVSSKSDIRASWMNVVPGTDRRTFLNIAFARAGAVGDTYLGIELNQSPVDWVNPKGASIPCRTDGDVLISYEVSNPPTVRLFKWQGTSGTAACPQGAGGTWLLGVTAVAGAEMALNSASATENFLPGGALGPVLEKSTFGEAALDLRAVADAVQYPGVCEYFRRVSVKSRSAAEISATLEDWVTARSITARSCESPPAGGGEGGGGSDVLAPAEPAVGAAAAVDCDGTVTLSGSAESGSTVTIYDDGVPVAFAQAAAGAWSAELGAVADGSHAYSADATDAAGNTSAVSGVIAIDVDATAPGTPVLTATSPLAGVVTLEGTAEPGVELRIARDGVHVATVTAGQNGVYTVCFQGVAAGEHTYAVAARDACRASAPAQRTVTVAAPADDGSGDGSGAGDGSGSGDGSGDGTGTEAGSGDAGDSSSGDGSASGSGPGSGDAPAGTITIATDPAPATPAAPGDSILTEVVMGEGATGVTACAVKPFKAYVRLAGVRRVTFMVDGRRVRTVRRADARGQFVGLITPSKLAPGPHALTAVVTFRAKNRKARTLRLRFRRCDECLSRRAFRIRVDRAAKGERAVSAKVFLNGRPVRTIRGRRLRAEVVLTGLPKGTYVVRIVTRTNRGRTFTSTRRYRTCVGAR